MLRGYIKYGSVILIDEQGNTYQIPMLADGSLAEEYFIIEAGMITDEEAEQLVEDGESFAVDLPVWENKKV
jgi:hypothetical protein